ncbi:hypothetical protein Patl1_16994 [Pistacia atlantica]|uniref:Uncharacterized protein n=1 Tax=Pistacia atlantica TaxID=434234 RepID=A0ACC1B669_9ROSI|nr:hypothetical protein Patl1_16994 [Pistacia atlantica]
MALKAVHVSDVPNLDQVPDNVALDFCATRFCNGVNGDSDEVKGSFKFPKFVVMGHRGTGMNMLQSPDKRMKSIKENTILAFNAATSLPLDFIEFDVQVTKDECPVIFHDNFILTQEKDLIVQKRVTDLSLEEFLSYGPQKEPGKVGKPMFRKLKDGRIFEWKFDDQIDYEEEQLSHILQVILQVVFKHAKDRPIFFSSFQPDAALLIRKLQSTYPVFFLTNGGAQNYTDVRRGSLDEAIKVCMVGGLQGIVSEVKAIFKNPGVLARIKECKLSLVTYGELNNVPEVVFLQRLMGVEGVIVDLVEEITEAVTDLISNVNGEEESLFGEDGKMILKTKLEISKDELSFLFTKLIPELIQSN